MHQEEKIIDLQLDPADGTYKPSRVRIKKQVKPKIQKQKVVRTKQQKEIQRVAESIEIPQIQQFLYGVNTALDIVERFKKAFK